MKKRGKQLFSLLLALTVTLGTLPATAFAAVGDIPTEDYKGSVHVGDEFDPGTTISVYCYGDDDETYAQYSPDVTFLTKVGDTAWPTSSAIEEDYSEYDNPLTFSPVYDAATEGTDTGYVATESYLYSGDDPDSSDNIEFYYLMLQKDTDRSSANSYYDYYTPVGLCYRSNEVFVQLTGEPYTTAVNNYNGVADSKKSGSNYNYFIHLPAAENQYEGVTAWVATKVDGRGDITFTAKTASYDPMDHMPWDYYGDTGWYYNAGGDATHYTISTAAELAGLAKLCNETEEPLFAGKTVKLGDDIDLSAHDWTPISFYGDYDGEIATFDGDGHSITGLSVKQGNFFFEGTCAGLFAGAADATLQNFTVSGEVYVTDCEVVGGVVGELYDATLVNVGSTVNVSASLAGGSVFAGGLAGFASGARILNCYALGDVSADASLNEVSTYNVPTPRAYAGGAAGALLDSVAFNCYHAVGTVSATGKEQGYGGIAGLVGSGTNSLDDPDPVTNCYSTTQNSAEDDHADGAFIDADKKVGDSSLMFKLNQKTGTAQPSEYSDVTFATWRCMSQYAWPTHEPQYGAEYSTDGGSTWTKCAKLGDILGKFDTGTAAQNKVRLLADDISSLIVPYSFTLDLQGHKWTASSVDSAPLTMSGTSGGEIVITDSVGGGKIIGADADATHAATSAIYVGGSRYDTSQTTSTAKLTLTGDKPFTIQGGQGLAESNNEQYRAGAPGIDVRNGGTLTVDVGANVTIQGGDSGALPSSSSGNYGTAGGAGVAVQSGSALQAGGGTFIGGDGGAGGSSKSGNGGAGVSAADSAAAVEITGGTFTGGTGGANASGIFGGDGGIGAYVSGGSFSASGGMFTGGTGGAGGTTTSGDGGDGLSLVDGVTSGPLSGLTCAGGTGGANTSGLFSGNGGDGLSLMNGVTSGPLSGLTCAGGAGGTGGTGGTGSTKDGRSGYGLYVSDVSVTVDGGSFSGSSALCAYATNTCQWRVNDGVFAGEAYGLDTTFYDGGGSSGSVSLTVAGGTFTGGSYGVSTDCAGSLAGGTFTGSDTLAYAVRNSAFSGTAAALLAPGKAYYDADGKTVDGSANDGIGEGKTLRVLDAGSAPAPLYSIGGTVVDSAGSSGVKGATVKLMQGKTQLAQTTTGSTGQYSFADIPAGLYNVVAETDEVTATILVELNTDAYDKDIRLPNGSKSSVVEVTGADTPDVIVGGVEEVAKNQSAGSDESITVKLTVEKQDSPANKDEIVAVAGDQTLLYLDVSLMLLKGSGEPQDLGSSNSKVLELVLPYDFTSKKDVTVYRYHGDNAGKLTKLDTAPSPAQDNTFWADTKNGYLHIYASQFSTYAVGYTPVTVNPGHSGGGSTPSYTITASAGAGGAISPSGKVSVTRNGSKTFTVTPNAGYIVADVLVDGKSAGAVTSYTFDKVTEAHTISARFEKAADKAAWNPFADVRESDWFYDSVKYVYEHDLMLGTSGTAFSPNAGTERGMIVTILWRMAGKPAAESGSAFSDVRSGAYYADAVAWADENGIVLGYGNGLFGPGDKITREQLAAILWRYAGSPAAGGALDGFADADSVSPYARDALRWAVEQNIVSGKGGGALDPKGPATRAEAAAMLERFSVSVK